LATIFLKSALILLYALSGFPNPSVYFAFGLEDFMEHQSNTREGYGMRLSLKAVCACFTVVFPQAKSV